MRHPQHESTIDIWRIKYYTNVSVLGGFLSEYGQ